ncbi:MAG: SDR family oxidoreductase [Gammaproteobacteria bacterium]|nr:SDR family oxidoreductase [Gammaproteobacteria bacterium]
MAENRDKSVLITGCSSGIGYCAARGLRGRGYRIFATARGPDDVQQLTDEGFEALQLDLDNSDSIQQAVKQVLEWSGGSLYALFNNGAYGQPGAVEDISRDVLKAQFETNLFGWHELTCLLIPIMRQQGFGRIIQNSSVLGFAAMKYRGAYNASKFALEGLTDTLRLELEGSGIHISLVEPGPITSQFRTNAYAMWKRHIAGHPTRHQAAYQAMEERLTKEGPAVPFTLPPEAVLKRVIHALESPRPRARYYVTVPTYLFGYLKRVLPARAMDWLLGKV